MRFSLIRRRQGGRHAPPDERIVELVDARSHEVHLLTQDAFARGMKTAAGKYIALCGGQVIAASMLVAAGRKRCVRCREHTTTVPAQRTHQKAPPPARPETTAVRDYRQFALSRIDGYVHRLRPIESSRVALQGFGRAACGQEVHTRELSSHPNPSQEGLCGLCWGLAPS